jgi:hypothetical protein
MACIDYTTRPRCPYPCAGSGCPHIRSDAECISCEHRPALDRHYEELEAWHDRQDWTGASHPYNSPALAGWGGGDR